MASGSSTNHKCLLRRLNTAHGLDFILDSLLLLGVRLIVQLGTEQQAQSVSSRLLHISCWPNSSQRPVGTLQYLLPSAHVSSSSLHTVGCSVLPSYLSLDDTFTYQSSIANCSVTCSISFCSNSFSLQFAIMQIFQQVIGLFLSFWFLKHHTYRIFAETHLRYPVVAQSRGDLAGAD